ncbi:MAG: diaminopimelate epimerase [Myxococcales bacterium]|nr:diaminopimelate epimerase [Myxococcota bacterium]MDW8284107.1 diaminopimelate epimerase [Myxococcales bacterium]
MTSAPLLSFVKVQGLGNDFVLLDVRHGQPPDWPGDAQAAIVLCDRHFGVGGDGLLLVGPSTVAQARMRVVNADGSEAEMCGNGLRCVAAYLWDRVRPEIAIETGAGVRSCRMHSSARGVEVEVDMGAPEVRFIQRPITVLDRDFVTTAIGLGNPHLITFLDGEEPLRELARRYGPDLEHHPEFPERTNVGFARPLEDGSIELVVWERGCGLTLACGTGACATAAAAICLGLRPVEAVVPVRLPGGTLRVRVHTGLCAVSMAGPAREVFRGVVPLQELVQQAGPRLL